MSCSSPIDQALNLSVKVFCTVIWNSENPDVVGIPVNPETGTVNTSPSRYP